MRAADQTSSQESIFYTIGKSITENCVAGYNGTVFAYGQTGTGQFTRFVATPFRMSSVEAMRSHFSGATSVFPTVRSHLRHNPPVPPYPIRAGKTYTMSGPTENGVPVGAVEQRGLIPRMFEYLFALIGREEKRSGGTKQFLCKASYLEIYQETIFDLQDPAAARGLNLREGACPVRATTSRSLWLNPPLCAGDWFLRLSAEPVPVETTNHSLTTSDVPRSAFGVDIKRGVFVDNLIETTVISADDCYKVLDDGARNRHVSPTSMNRESSRSHSVFTLVIQSKEVSATGISNVKVSHLNLVDLAGSERQKLTGRRPFCVRVCLCDCWGKWNSGDNG